MALFALSLESVTGLKYLHFKEVRELVLSEGTAKTLCADVRVTPARLLCLHIHGSLLQPDSLRLGGYPALRSLSLQGAGLQAVPPALPAALTHLSLAGNELQSLEGLALPRLKWLDISSNKVKALEALAACPALQHLACADNPLAALEPLPALASVAAQRCGVACLAALRPLALASHLTRLALAGNPCVAGLSPQRRRVLIGNLLPGLKVLDGHAVRAATRARTRATISAINDEFLVPPRLQPRGLPRSVRVTQLPLAAAPAVRPAAQARTPCAQAAAGPAKRPQSAPPAAPLSPRAHAKLPPPPPAPGAPCRREGAPALLPPCAPCKRKRGAALAPAAARARELQSSVARMPGAAPLPLSQLGPGASACSGSPRHAGSPLLRDAITPCTAFHAQPDVK